MFIWCTPLVVLRVSVWVVLEDLEEGVLTRVSRAPVGGGRQLAGCRPRGNWHVGGSSVRSPGYITATSEDRRLREGAGHLTNKHQCLQTETPCALYYKAIYFCSYPGWERQTLYFGTISSVPEQGPEGRSRVPRPSSYTRRWTSPPMTTFLREQATR